VDNWIEKRVLVCCGAGGVGKTTLSAALSILAARRGRRVLVVTIDPSRRLAETLGVARNPKEPVPLTPAHLKQAGITGTLHVWMLDPQLISDQAVYSFMGAQAEHLLSNPIYQNVTAMVAGMQEYTAMEALYRFVQEDRYDLIILDTPPSRDALRFLEAPSRLGAFLDRRVFNLFLHNEEAGFIRRMATRLIERVFDLGFGQESRLDLQEFFQLSGGIFQRLNHNQAEMKRFFQQPEVGFLLVTSPRQEALEEAFYFERKTRDELGLHLLGYLLNRSLAATSQRSELRPELLRGLPEGLQGALLRLQPLAAIEAQRAQEHAALAQTLAQRAGQVRVLPSLPRGAAEMEALLALADELERP